MSEKLEKAKAIRADKEVRTNCCQAVLIPFCGQCGLDEATARQVSRLFGSGMHCGSVCGAVTGALMALGLCGADDKAGAELIRRFREEHGAVNCAELLKAAKERGEERKPHCDRMVFTAVEMAEELLKKE